MIKEKDSFKLTEDESMVFSFLDDNRELTVEFIANFLRQCFEEVNLPVNITVDDYQYKESTFKKNLMPCVVISNSENEKAFSKYVVAYSFEKNVVSLIGTINGISESVRLYNKAMKNAKKADRSKEKSERNSELGDITRSTGNFLVRVVRDKKAERLYNKAQELAGIEREYNDRVISVVNASWERLSQSYQCIDKRKLHDS